MNGATNITPDLSMNGSSTTNGYHTNGIHTTNGAHTNSVHTTNGTHMNGNASNGTSSADIIKKLKLDISSNGVQNGSSHAGNHVFDDGALLQKILEITNREKLVAGMTEKEKVVEFRQPEELKALLELSIERSGCSNDELDEIMEKVVKYSVRTQHPHFYNQLYGGIDEVGLGGAWLTEALNTNQYTFEVAPVFLLVEQFVMQWMVELLGWQDGDGIFAPGGSISNMYGLVLARYQRHPEVKKQGIFGMKPLTAFVSDQSHYSISKSANWLGIGMDHVIKVPSDDQGKMIPSELKKAIEVSRDDGCEPFFVCATAGTTVLGAYDDLEAISQICTKEKMWLHVDGCWGGSAMLSQKHKHLLNGIDKVDSIAWNPHKMLGASLQCSCFVTRHKRLLQESNSANASYLFQQDKYYDVSYDTGDKSIQCGRKVDAFKLWFMLRVYGLDKCEKKVDAAFDAARHLHSEVVRRSGFRSVLPSYQCTNVGFWYIPPSLQNRTENQEWWKKLSEVAPAIKARMVKDGTLMIGYQPLSNKNYVNFFRMVTTGTPTPTSQHMDFVLDEIERLGNDL
ncbi:unnamed protein product [Meganyctiphanes norvegica]|uniref:Glutamate decarboxylase n=1 Tax=Meganyctiphanes norvegica TaxID=48144 RepID=A0AAV2Q2E1_MEGNR